MSILRQSKTRRHQAAVETCLQQICDAFANKPVVISVNGREISRVVNNANKRNGRSK